MKVILILATVAAVIASIGVIWNGAIKPMWKTIRKLGDMHEEIMRMPADRAEMNTFKQEMVAFRDATLHELHPNSGGSLKDQVTTIEQLVSNHVNDVNIHDLGP